MKSMAQAADHPLEPFLEGQGVVVLDGGLATELEARGHRLADELWSARLLAEAPEAIREVHAAYLEAGADCIATASYQASFEGFARRGLSEEEAVELLRLSVRLAVEERDRFWERSGGRGGRLRPLVVASIGPYGAFLADGSEYRGDYGLGRAELAAFHAPRLDLLAASGADLLAFETIPSAPEALAVGGLLAEMPTARAWLSFCCQDDRHLADGTRLEEVAAELEGLPQILALGINCVDPRRVDALIGRLRRATSRPVAAYPNSGETWNASRRAWEGGTEACVGAESVRRWHRLGASLIGGCCRLGPAWIRAARASLLG